MNITIPQSIHIPNEVLLLIGVILGYWIIAELTLIFAYHLGILTKGEYKNEDRNKVFRLAFSLFILIICIIVYFYRFFLYPFSKEGRKYMK